MVERVDVRGARESGEGRGGSAERLRLVAERRGAVEQVGEVEAGGELERRVDAELHVERAHAGQIGHLRATLRAAAAEFCAAALYDYSHTVTQSAQCRECSVGQAERARAREARECECESR